VSRWPNRMPMDERAEVAWRMRQQRPPASWATIAKACGLSASANAHRWFSAACRKRGLPRDFALWESGGPPYPTVARYRQYLTGEIQEPDFPLKPGYFSPAEIDELCESLRLWLEWDAARRDVEAHAPCPMCNGLGTVRVGGLKEASHSPLLDASDEVS